MRLTVLAALFLIAGFNNSYAEYTPNHIISIPWGDSAHQLKIGQPFMEDVELTPEDTTDDAIFPGGGPNQGFVDFEENFYFSSYEFSYLKGFNSNGEILVQYSNEDQDHDRDFFKSGVSKFTVDSQGFLYILGFPVVDYIALVDQDYNLISKLNPYGENSGIKVNNFFRSSHDVLSFYLSDGTRHTYSEGNFVEGGAMGWKAEDGLYYYANMRDSSLIRFIRYENPDLNGNPSNMEEFLVPLENNIISYCEFLGMDYDLNSFIYVIKPTEEVERMVLVFDSEYNLTDEILLASATNSYYWIFPPFMREDGVIYEFQVLDEHLDIIRWSKE